VPPVAYARGSLCLWHSCSRPSSRRPPEARHVLVVYRESYAERKGRDRLVHRRGHPLRGQGDAASAYPPDEGPGGRSASGPSKGERWRFRLTPGEPAKRRCPCARGFGRNGPRPKAERGGWKVEAEEDSDRRRARSSTLRWRQRTITSVAIRWIAPEWEWLKGAAGNAERPAPERAGYSLRRGRL